MYIKLIGAGLILAGCGGCGIRLAMLHRSEVTALHQVLQVLDGMLCELEFRLTPLPELCRIGSEYASGGVQRFFLSLADEMDQQVSVDVRQCTAAALKQVRGLPAQTTFELENLGQSLGRYDLQGQINSLRQCKQSCLNRLKGLEHQQSQRLRSYQTLGFCAGLALAILLF